MVQNTVFGGVAIGAKKSHFLADFTQLDGVSLQGLTDGRYTIVIGVRSMTYVEGRCPENKQTVRGYRTTRPDDKKHLEELGFKPNNDLDVPEISVNRPQLRQPAL